MAIVFPRVSIDLAPFPPEKRHQVGVFGISRYRVAFANTLLCFFPEARGDAFGMVVNGPEVQIRTVARKIAGICRRLQAAAPHDRQGHNEGVRGKGGVNVQITEDNLLLDVVLTFSRICFCVRWSDAALSSQLIGQVYCRNSASHDNTAILRFTAARSQSYAE